MPKTLRIGTRDSQLAVWQATLVKDILATAGYRSELVYMKSEGDLDIVTPLYELGVQGVFTKTLDAAVLNERVDIAVHSMKDVPTRLAKGIAQAAVLERASTNDILVYKEEDDLQKLGYNNGSWENPPESACTIATGSVRRIAQWLNRYPNHQLENLRGNVNTRLRKLEESNWNGAIFAAAGLERINLRPSRSVDLEWMLPAPAQGAIMVVCRESDTVSLEACKSLDHKATALCTKIERDFLRTLLGGCSTPVSARAVMNNGTVLLEGNIVSPDGKEKIELKKELPVSDADSLGLIAGQEILNNGGDLIMQKIRKNGL